MLVEFEGILLDVFQVAVLIFSLVIMSMVAWIAFEFAANLRTRLRDVANKPSVLAFGQSPVGVAVHDSLVGLLPKVDEADDAAIKKIALLLQIRKLGIDESTFRQGLASALSEALQIGVDLVDGVASEPPGE